MSIVSGVAQLLLPPVHMRLAALVLPLALLVPASASAADTWDNPHSGIWHLNRTTSTPWQIDVLQVDLCVDGVGLRATRSEERQSRTSNWASDVGAHAAVNGDFFSYSGYGTSGLAVGDGAAWPSTSDSGSHGFVAFGWDRAELSPPPEVRSVEGWMREVVGGNVHLVSGGVAMSSDSGSFCTTRHPRTAVGFSEDGRTLILAVVDGRTSASAGMRCSELAGLMLEMGAHEALNLDGGGSTSMYVAGDGVVNNPSDGSERVVANHLGVFANGLLERPDSCDRNLDAGAYLSGAWTGTTSTDVDGDGLADVCGRDPQGFQCFLSPDDTPVASPGLSDASGWSDPSNASTIRMGDVTGDGRADLCARADAGVVCWPSEGESFGAMISGPAWSDEAGWDAPKYYGTLHLADVDGDGRDDVCGRTGEGFACYLSDGAGFPISIGMDDLSDAVGWGHPRYYGTIRMGDVDGDGRADVCARAAAGWRCWPSLGDGFAASAWAGPDWTDEAGWDDHARWATIRLLDLDGDGLADACGRGAAGLECYRSTGAGFGPLISGPAWADDGGWADWPNASTIRFGDLDGDGDADVCARANSGVTCALYEDDAFGATFAGPVLDDAGAWDLQRFHSTMRLADVDGDGSADLCARGWSGMRCWASLGASFAEESVLGPGWGEPAWSAPDAYTTIRLVTPPPPPPEPGDDDDATPPDGDDDDATDDDDDDDVAADDDDDDAGALQPPELSPVPPGLGCEGCSGGGATYAWLLLCLPGLRLRRRRR